MRKLWVEKASDIAKEYYLSLTFDRGTKQALYMFTTQGGIDIEQVAEESRRRWCGSTSIRWRVSTRGRRGGSSTAPAPSRRAKQIAAIVGRLHEAFVRFDAMLCEINPLIVTPEGDVKRSTRSLVDDKLFRHPEVAEMRDRDAADPLEALAREARHVRQARRGRRRPRQRARG